MPGRVFDLVAQEEIGARVAGLGLVELVADGGEGVGPAGRGERVEPDSSWLLPGMMSPEVVRASRMRA